MGGRSSFGPPPSLQTGGTLQPCGDRFYADSNFRGLFLIFILYLSHVSFMSKSTAFLMGWQLVFLCTTSAFCSLIILCSLNYVFIMFQCRILDYSTYI